MQAVIGRVRHVKVARADRSALRQMDSLQLFAAACRKGQLAATRVAPDEVCLEGVYYIVLLLCVPCTLEKETYFNTDTFEAGIWWCESAITSLIAQMLREASARISCRKGSSLSA